MISLRMGAISAICGVLGFVGARMTLPSKEAGSSHPKAAASAALVAFPARSLPPTIQAAANPEGLLSLDFTDAVGFRRYVDRLEAETGIDEKFAQWIALTLLAKRDFPAAFRIAMAEKLIALWASGAAVLDPEAAMAAIRGLPMRDSDMALNGLLLALGRIDPQRGEALLAALPSITAGKVAFWFFQNWAGMSLDASLKGAMAMKPRSVRDRALAGVFQVWGLNDRRGMLEWASTQEDSIGKNAFRSSYEAIGVRDPAEMLDLAQEFPRAVNWMVVAEISRTLVGQGSAGWDAILRLPEGSLRNEVMFRAGGDMAHSDPQGAWKVFQSLPVEDQPYFLRSSADVLAKIAPKEMAEKAATGEIGPSYVLRDVMKTWAQTDAPGAFAWSDEHLTGSVKTDALREMLTGMAATDPVSATAAVEKLSPGLRATLLPDVVRAWASASPVDAIAWAKSRPALDRSRAVDAVVKGWSEKDPVAAAQVLLEMPSEGLESSYDTVSGNLARSKPAYAFQWASNLGDNGLRNQTIENVASVWGNQDAAAAAQQLSQMKAGDLRDSAVKGYVQSVQELDPETAASWASSIQKPDVRQRSLRNVLVNWRKSDSAAAAAFVNGLPVGSLKDEMLPVVGN